jgi:excisionase family DNA binding protein
LAWLTAREVAVRLRVNERTVRRAIARGELPAVKDGGVFRISTAAVERYLSRRDNRGSPRQRSGIDRAHLPTLPTSLVGRAAEIDAALRLFAAASARLVTLTGPGGVGKTRLALAIAAAFDSGLVDEIVFVSLESVRQPDLVANAIAHACGVPESGTRPLLAVLEEVVRRRRLLLVLDNFEHVLPASGVLARLLAAGPDVRVLVTSREVLRLRGEHELVVLPLVLPSPESVPSAATVVSAPATRLFVERARAAAADFQLNNTNAALVFAICRRLDGLPLAIELAAAQAKHLSLAELLVRLERRLETLTGGPVDMPQRLRTMRSAIAWSVDRLDTEEQALLRRLSVFAGSFDQTAAVAVGLAMELQETPGRSDDREATRVRLASLVDKSLLSQESAVGESRRYRMLETIREFAWDQLVANGEAEAACAAHAAHYLALSEEMARHYYGPREAAAFARLESEIGNLRAVLAWAQGRDGDIGVGLRLACALWWFWDVRGYVREGWDSLQALLASPEAERWPSAKAYAIVSAGLLATRMQMRDEARASYQEALERFERLQDDVGVAFARIGLGADILFVSGDVDTAVPLLMQATTTFEAAGEHWRLAATCWVLTLAALARGDVVAARVWAKRHLSLAQQDGMMQTKASALASLGLIARLSGDLTEALRLFREALHEYRGVGDRGNVCMCVEALAGLLASLAHPERAAELFGMAAALRERTGIPITSHERPGYERDVAATRDALSADAFEKSWASGEAAALDDLFAALPWQELAVADDAGTSETTIRRGATSSLLTRREREVLGYVARGLTDKEIARLLSRSPETVTKHVGNAMRRLGVSSRAAAVALAISAQPEAPPAS